MLVQGGYVNMSDNKVCVIGGYDLLAKAFYSELKKKEDLSIFINVDDTRYINRRGVFNFKIIVNHNEVFIKNNRKYCWKKSK